MKFTTVPDWLCWLETLHPLEIELGLDRIDKVAQSLAVKNFDCPVVVISGTNGKGSCLALLESIALAHKFRVGCYSSPHLISFNERIRFDGHPVDDQALMQAFDSVENARGSVSLSYFEFSTLAALVLFKQADAEQELDLLVLEVGLGGRLDAVNIVDNDLAIITSIDYDHTQWLGESLEEIGYEKAGIFRSNGVAIIGERNIPNSVKHKAGTDNVSLLCNGKDYSLTRIIGSQATPNTQQSVNTLYWQGAKARFEQPKGGIKPVLDDVSSEKVTLSLALSPATNSFSAVQSLALDNIATALQALFQLPLNLSEHNILKGIENVQIAGRFEIIQGETTTILDVAHNPAAARLCAEKYLQLIKPANTVAAKLPINQQKGRLHIVVGLLNDKDYSAVLSPFIGIAHTWYPCNVPSARSRAADTLYNYLIESGAKVSGKYLHPKIAYNQAKANASTGDCILVYGSFYTVAAVKGLFT